MNPCDHTSVGVLVFQNKQILLIDRATPPFGLAAPAGHVDSRASFEEAALAELQEETGLEVVNELTLIGEGRKDTPCRRGGEWHYWKIYRATAHGELRPSKRETKGAQWYSKGEVFVKDLEPVWQQWFHELDILNMPGLQ